MNNTSNIKRLVATDKKYHEAPVFIAPKEDSKTRKVIDYASRVPEELREQITISLEPKKDRDDNVIDEMIVRASHLQVFDLNNGNDCLLFEVVKEDNMIAPSKDAVNPQFHRYYIEDKEKEATALISKSKLKSQAFAIIAQLSTEQMENYARVLGKYVKGLSGTQIESALYEITEKTPQLILDVDNDKDLKYKIFIRRCLDRQIIHMDNSKYMNGKDIIGINEAYAILWMKDPSNSPLITQWNRMLDGGIGQAAEEPKIEAFTPAGEGDKIATPGMGQPVTEASSDNATDTTVDDGAGNPEPGDSDPNLNDQQPKTEE